MEEQQHSEQEKNATSGIAKVLFGKALSGKLFSVFSDRLLYWLLLATAFLLPIFFIPGNFIAPEFAKMIFLEALVFISVFVWGMGRLREGVVEIPKSWLFLVALLLIVQFIVAAIVSPAPLVSFIGSGYDLGTVNSLTVLFLLMFLVSISFVTRDRILALYAALFFSGVIVMAYHLLRYFFGADFLDFGVFTSAVSTPVGKWNDFAILVGAITMLTLTASHFFPKGTLLRVLAPVLFVVCLFFLLLVDFTVLWVILFVLSGLLVAFAIYEKRRGILQETKEGEAPHRSRSFVGRLFYRLPVLPALLLLVSFVYGSGIAAISWGENNTTIAALVGKVLRPAPYTEVVLTPQFTFDIVTSTIKESAFFGAGPNRFSSSYFKYKTEEINKTPFWDTRFDFGLGHIPTFFTTTGLIGMLLWIVFMVLVIAKARKVFKLFARDRIAAFLAFSLFTLTVYFWSVAFFYLPNAAIFALAFLFTGALIGFLVHEGVLTFWKMRFGEGSRTSFIATPVIIIILVGVVASGVLLYRQLSSLVAFQRAQVALSSGNIPEAVGAISHANDLFERDVYHRALSNLALANLERLANEKMEEQELATLAGGYITEARLHAERAVALDPTNFENYLSLGAMYDVLGTLGIQNAASFARENYEQALRLNPKSPRVLFVLARLELVNGEKEKAKQILYRALAERPNFLEALSFVTQIELQDRNPEAAVLALQKGIAVEPQNFLLHFSLGHLFYQQGDYKAAIPEFESAVILNPVYANAKYFLGLSYAEVGRRSDAITQFTEVQTLNPDNQDVVRIINNLKSGRVPLDSGSSGN